MFMYLFYLFICFLTFRQANQLKPPVVRRQSDVNLCVLIKTFETMFSINFANETNDHPQSIAYHFKWDVAKKMLIEDYKEDNEWKKRNATAFDIFDGLEFALEFAFQDDGIYVYMVCEDARNHVTHFQPEIDIQFIESVQVWGDVEKITQLSFSYN
nr:uncharacterized protein LOC106623491 isoform X2 [Bactrocera oleae]